MGRTRKQGSIPGTEAITIKELDNAAEAYVEARDERMEKSEAEKEAKNALLAVMKKHKLDVYKDESTDPPLIVTLVPGTDDVKVKAQKEPAAAEAEI